MSIKNSIKSEKYEFHCHTKNSFDCNISLRERIKSYASNGFTHLAITDHDEVLKEGDYKVIEEFNDKLQIIPAIEVSSLVGHIILLGCKKKPLFNSLAYLVLISKIYKYDIYLPHPTRSGTGFLKESKVVGLPHFYISWFVNFIKYIEVWNPRDKIRDPLEVNSDVYNKLHNKIFVIASDSHYTDDINMEGCTKDGISHKDLRVKNFFELKIKYSENKNIFKIRSLARYIKSNIKYSIGC